jgi:hypothetical protein
LLILGLAGVICSAVVLYTSNSNVLEAQQRVDEAEQELSEAKQVLVTSNRELGATIRETIVWNLGPVFFLPRIL